MSDPKFSLGKSRREQMIDVLAGARYYSYPGYADALIAAGYRKSPITPADVDTAIADELRQQADWIHEQGANTDGRDIENQLRARADELGDERHG